jgi:hypothetical protein
MRWLKEYLKWLKSSLPVIEDGRVHFTRDSLILIFVVVCALLFSFYLLGVLAGHRFL